MEGLMSKFFPSRQKVPTKRGKKTQGEDPAAGAASKLQEFHHLARDVLKRAVTYDESGRKPLALQHYRKARQLVQEALGIDVHPNAAAAVGGIEKELLSWNASCADRIGQLEQEVLSTTTTTTTSSSSSSSSILFYSRSSVNSCICVCICNIQNCVCDVCNCVVRCMCGLAEALLL